MEKLKTIAIDIKHSVFENETEAIMYVTKDIYDDSYIISIPVISFSWEIRNEREERDYSDLLRFNVFGDVDKKERLVATIKEGIAEFERC